MFKDTIALAEHHLYGSSRLGIKSYPDSFLYSNFDATQQPAVYSHAMSAERPWFKYNNDILMDFPLNGYIYIPSYTVSRYLGWKNYELSDHLGNVNVSVLDKISGTGNGVTGQYAYLSANISSLTDYYPFGMPMPNRSISMNKYRFGFNGMEKDDEVKGAGNSMDFGARMYDSRLGRWMSVDPLGAKYPSLSPYNFVGNSPICFVDPDGRKVIAVNKDAQQILILGLSPQESKYVEFDENGVLNTSKLELGASTLKEMGGNYKALLHISNATEIVLISIENNPIVLDGNSNSVLLNTATIEEEFVFDYDKFEYTDKKEKIVQGTLGIYLTPLQWENYTEFDKIQNSKISKEDSKYSSSGNFQVIVSKNLFEFDKKKAVGTAGHELYGHVYFLLLKNLVKGGLHGSVRTADNVNANENNYNEQLETQIYQRQKESTQNYDKHTQ